MGMIEAALLAQALTQGRLQKALLAGMVAERGELANARIRARAVAAARSKWLFDHEAERSFPCGVVRPDGLIDASVRERRPELAVIAAVLPATLAFLVEPPPTYPGDEPIEAGSIERSAIGAIEVVGTDGRPVPRPQAEPVDPEPEVVVSIGWTDAAGSAAAQRLLFRSSWEAWTAADRLRQASSDLHPET
jgi:hypothetical protein